MTIPADPIIDRISAAVTAYRESRAEPPRDDLLALWAELGPDGSALHRCSLAHYLADMYDDPALALMWNTRALDAAAGLPAEHRAFSPSLYLNLADDLRRLGSFTAAGEYLAKARDGVAALGDDAYGDLIRTALAGVDRAIRDRSTAPSATAS